MVAALDRLLLLVRREFRRPSHFHAARLGAVAAFARARSNDYPLHLVERDFLGAAQVTFGHASGQRASSVDSWQKCRRTRTNELPGQRRTS
jgi:hypothetical protein